MTNNKLMLSALFALAGLAPELAAQKPDSGAFFVRLGNDTIAVETYVRTPQQLLATALLRTPQTRRYKLTVTRSDEGTVSWYEVVNDPVRGVPNPAPPMRKVVTYVGDSARVETWFNAVSRPGRALLAAGTTMPLELPFYSTYETALMQARRNGGDSATVTMLGANGPFSYVVRWTGQDSVSLTDTQGGVIRARVDRDGRLLDFNGENTTFKVVVTRGEWADLAALEKRYATGDAAGQALGALSPRDSLEFTVGQAIAMIGYGRPSMRGRTIFGGIVPWGAVWRTGANAATQLMLTEPVEIHGVEIPAGKYSLWTVPDRKTWRLIINKQTGQWGTNYDETQNLASIEVVSETIGVPLETFTIAAEEKDDSSTILTLTWDRTRVVVPMKYKPPSP